MTSPDQALIGRHGRQVGAAWPGSPQPAPKGLGRTDPTTRPPGGHPWEQCGRGGVPTPEFCRLESEVGMEVSVDQEFSLDLNDNTSTAYKDFSDPFWDQEWKHCGGLPGPTGVALKPPAGERACEGEDSAEGEAPEISAI
ncbi:unnamed protein product, partial [Gulo gulo]